MGLKDIGDGLAALIDDIDSLRVYPPKDTPDILNELPAVVILPGEVIYNQSFDPDYDAVFRVLLLLAKIDQPSAFNKLFDYMEPTGASSIKAKIESDATLGATCDTSIVRNCTGAGTSIWGGITYLSSEWSIEIHANE